MFDYHMHTVVSFDGHDRGVDMAMAAKAKGLKEICFTDHVDYEPCAEKQTMVFDPEKYSAEYDDLEVPGLKIRRGIEFGILPDNAAQFQAELAKRHYDFVLGSVHFADGLDVYFEPFWRGKTVHEVERRYLEEMLTCVQNHDAFDVLAHLSFISKASANTTHSLLKYADHREIVDEILKVLVRKGKGMEMNTSGVDRVGGFLPTQDFFRRFKELGGEIVTVGSDAHNVERVGQYTDRACQIMKDIFGYVCTFEDRKPIFHKL